MEPTELVGEHLGLDRDARLFWHFRQDHARAFSALTRVHRTTFVRQAANLGRVKQRLQRRLARCLAGTTADGLVDSMPLPVCRCGRGGYGKGFRGQPAFGYDPVQQQADDGFGLYLRSSRAGVILAYELAPANAADTTVLPELAPPPGTTGIGDRHSWSPPADGGVGHGGGAAAGAVSVEEAGPGPGAVAAAERAALARGDGQRPVGGAVRRQATGGA